MTTTRKQEQQEAAQKLREWVNEGDTVYTVLRHVARSGMSRSIDLLVFRGNEPIQITYWAARLLDERIDRDRGGIKMSGAGMDMGFALVYNLSHALWSAGYTCSGFDCHSNDHSNGDRERSPHHHNDGGYALRQRWL